MKKNVVTLSIAAEQNRLSLIPFADTGQQLLARDSISIRPARTTQNACQGC